MSERTDTYMATIAGAIVGGAVGFFFFTEPGRELRRRMEPMVDGLADELTRFRGTLLRAASVANDGWGLMHDVVGEVRSWPAGAWRHKQSQPF